MKIGDTIDLGNGFSFKIVSENQSEKSFIGFFIHNTELMPIGQTSILKTFLLNFIK
jgi:hypothetical protein